MSEHNPNDIRSAKNLVYKSRLYARGDIYIGDVNSISPTPKRLTFHKGFSESTQGKVPRDFYRLSKSKGKSDLVDRRVEIDDIYDVLLKRRRVVLLGKAGLGKSVELQQIAFNLNHNYNLPVALISLKDVEQAGVVPLFYVDQQEVNIANDGVLLLDGLDEVNPESARKAIQDIARGFPQMRILVTCRTNVYSQQLGRFYEVRIDKFSTAQFDQFLSQKIGNERKEQFIQAVPSSDFRELLLTPFYLEKATAYFLENDFTLPESKTELLEYFISESLIIRLQDSSVLNSSKRDRDLCLTHLKKVAFVAECMGQNQLTIGEFKVLIDGNNELELIFNKSSLIHSDSDNVQFTHRILQEFLAAQTLVQRSSLRSVRRIVCSDLGYQIVKPSWTNTLSYLWELKKDDARFCQKFMDWLLKSNPNLVISFEGSGISEAIKVAIVQRTLDRLLKDGITFDYHQYNPISIIKFCENNSVFKYLKKRLFTSQSDLDKSNILRLLEAFSVAYAASDNDGELRELLLQMIINSSDPYFRSLATGVIVKVYGKVEPDFAQDVADRYFDSYHSVYDRNSAYRLITIGKIQNGWFERLLRRLIEIDENKFSAVLMVDEPFYLEECIANVNDKESILSYFELYRPVFRTDTNYHGKVFFKEFTDKMLSLDLDEKDQNRVFSSVREIIFEGSHLDINNVIPDCIRFIEVYNKQEDFIDYCLTRATEYPQYLVAYFLTADSFSKVITAFKAGSVDEKWIKNLTARLHFRDLAIEEQFISAINDQAGTNFVVREDLDTPTEAPNEISERLWRGNFDILFSKGDFINAVRALFSDLDVESLGSKKVQNHVLERGRENYSAFFNQHLEVVIRYVNHHLDLTQEELLKGLEEHWTWYSIRAIQLRLYRRLDYELEVSQQDYLLHWCDEHAPKVSLADRVTNSDQVLFFYIPFLQLKHYPPPLYIQGIRYGMTAAYPGEKNLLSLCNEIEGVSTEDIKAALIEGITSKTIKGYAIHQSLGFMDKQQSQDFSPALLIIIKDPKSKIRPQALKTYLTCKGDKGALLEILIETPSEDDFEGYLLNALADSNSLEVFEILRTRFQSAGDKQTKLRYAKHLCRYSDRQGLAYLLEYAATEKKTPFENDWPGQEQILSEKITAIPMLLKLYEQGFAPSMEQEATSMIQARVRATLRNMALRENGKDCKRVVRRLRFWGWRRSKFSDFLKLFSLATPDNLDAVSSMNYFLNDIVARYHIQQRMSFDEAIRMHKGF